MTTPEQFYAPTTMAWREYAENHLGDPAPTGVLACALSTVCDAYEYARTFEPPDELTVFEHYPVEEHHRMSQEFLRLAKIAVNAGLVTPEEVVAAYEGPGPIRYQVLQLEAMTELQDLHAPHRKL